MGIYSHGEISRLLEANPTRVEEEGGPSRHVITIMFVHHGVTD